MKKIVVIILSFFITIGLYAQKNNRYPYNEIFFGVGTTHYFGEIGGSLSHEASLNIKDFDAEQTRISASAGFRRVFNRSISLSGQIAPLWISGNDKLSYYNEQLNYNRKFNTYGAEIFSFQVEYYPANFVYLFGGFGELYRCTEYVPDYSITPIQKEKTHGFSSFILGGVGFGWKFNKLNAHSIEIGMRYCFDDILDGYDGGYDSKSNDIYYLVQYKIVHRLTFGSRFNQHGMLIR